MPKEPSDRQGVPGSEEPGEETPDPTLPPSDGSEFQDTAMMEPPLSNEQDEIPSVPSQKPDGTPEQLLIDGRYQLEEILGEGGMGAVYRGTHILMDKPVAVKLIRGQLAHIPEIVQRFHREAKSASRLTDPHCITVTDFGRTEDGTLFLVMELLDGKSLADLLSAEGALDPARAIQITKHILKALIHAHDAGVIHRDLKPENVMLVDQGDEADFAKVFDFGIAKLASDGDSVDNLTEAGLIVGTPAYLAPEQGIGSDADHRADLYAVGVMLYEMLAGCRPFTGSSAVDIVYAHLGAPIPALPRTCTAPKGMQKMIRRALAKKQEERFQSAQMFHDALDQIDLGKTAKSSFLQSLIRFFYPLRNAVSRQLARRMRALPTPVRARLEQMNPTGLVRMADPVRDQFSKLNPSKRRLVIRAGLAAAVILAIAGIATFVPSKQTFVKPAELDAVKKPGLDEEVIEKLFNQVDEQLANGLYLAAQGTAEQALNISPSQPVGHLLLGHALFLADKRRRAMESYATALKLDGSLAKDARLGTHLKEGLKSSQSQAAAARILVRYGGAAGVEMLASQANSALTDPEDREVARRALLENNHEEAIDWVATLTADLNDYDSCKKRSQVIREIVETKDPDFLPLLESHLEKAKSDRGSPRLLRRLRIAGRDKGYRCIKRELEKAIKILGDL